MPINPINWHTKESEKPAFMGHFLCFDRWDPPTDAEKTNGFGHHGEANSEVWELLSELQTKDSITARTMLHCCCGIYELIPELIEAGFEILNPVQINAANMEPERLKNEFGRDITFWGGGCETKSILNRATPQQVKDHVKHNLEVFTKGGGYVFNTVHNIMPDVPPENIVAMFEAINEF